MPRLVVLAALAMLAAGFEPAQRTAGSIPALPANPAGWTQAAFELEVSDAGAVAHVTALAATPGTVDQLKASLEDWRFRPALGPAGASSVPVASHVSVTVIFRPPQLYNGPALGTPPAPIEKAADDTPVATHTPVPAYPVNSYANGVVVVEMLVDPNGRVTRARAVAGQPPFTSLSVTSAKSWTFRPAKHAGVAVPSYAYAIFGFMRPVV